MNFQTQIRWFLLDFFEQISLKNVFSTFLFITHWLFLDFNLKISVFNWENWEFFVDLNFHKNGVYELISSVFEMLFTNRFLITRWTFLSKHFQISASILDINFGSFCPFSQITWSWWYYSWNVIVNLFLNRLWYVGFDSAGKALLLDCFFFFFFGLIWGKWIPKPWWVLLNFVSSFSMCLENDDMA